MTPGLASMKLHPCDPTTRTTPAPTAPHRPAAPQRQRRRQAAQLGHEETGHADRRTSTTTRSPASSHHAYRPPTPAHQPATSNTQPAHQSQPIDPQAAYSRPAGVSRSARLRLVTAFLPTPPVGCPRCHPVDKLGSRPDHWNCPCCGDDRRDLRMPGEMGLAAVPVHAPGHPICPWSRCGRRGDRWKRSLLSLVHPTDLEVPPRLECNPDRRAVARAKCV